MENEEFTKRIFFAGYNYHLRYYNILRKINDLEENAERFQKIVNDQYKPLKFGGGEILKNGVPIAKIKSINVKMKSEVDNRSESKKVSSIPYTEECKYYLMIDIIAETTQYCADLASILIGLKDFKTSKSTFSQIQDARLKKWYQNLQEPSLKDFLEILDLGPINELSLEERFTIKLRYDQFIWNLKKIGIFYSHNYDYLYIPFRHGMKGSFWKDAENRVFCRTLTKDKRYNLLYLSNDRIKNCQKIADLVFRIFQDDIEPTLFSKVFFLFLGKQVSKVTKAPILPNVFFRPDDLKKKFESLKGFKIHHFKTTDIASIHNFAKNPENNIEYNYKKMERGTSYCTIDGVEHYLDSFFTFSKKLKDDEHIIICDSPLAFYMELAIISSRTEEIYDLIMNETREYIFHYLALEKNIDYVFKDPTKFSHRRNQFINATNEILNEFMTLIGLYYNQKIYEKLEFSKQELEFLVNFFEKKMIRLLNMKNYMEKLHSDIILQIIFQMLIINYFEPFRIETYFEEFQLKDPKTFLTTSISILQNSVENHLNFDGILEFLNFIFETIDNLEKNT